MKTTYGIRNPSHAPGAQAVTHEKETGSRGDTVGVVIGIGVGPGFDIDSDCEPDPDSDPDGWWM